MFVQPDESSLDFSSCILRPGIKNAKELACGVCLLNVDARSKVCKPTDRNSEMFDVVLMAVLIHSGGKLNWNFETFCRTKRRALLDACLNEYETANCQPSFISLIPTETLWGPIFSLWTSPAGDQSDGIHCCGTSADEQHKQVLPNNTCWSTWVSLCTV